MIIQFTLYRRQSVLFFAAALNAVRSRATVVTTTKPTQATRTRPQLP